MSTQLSPEADENETVQMDNLRIMPVGKEGFKLEANLGVGSEYDKWHHISVSKFQDELTAYVDGVAAKMEMTQSRMADIEATHDRTRRDFTKQMIMEHTECDDRVLMDDICKRLERVESYYDPHKQEAVVHMVFTVDADEGLKYMISRKSKDTNAAYHSRLSRLSHFGPAMALNPDEVAHLATAIAVDSSEL